MKTIFRWPAALLLPTLILLTADANAGRTCEDKAPTKESVERGLNLAAQTMKSLDESGNRVVILARAGQDLSKYGLRYSHLGFAYQQPDGRGGHVWRVLHKLNQCGSSESGIYRQGLGEFFLDDLWRNEGAYVVPARDVQERLLTLIQDDRQALRMHHKPYSTVSYVWGQKYQQSNQWAIETLAVAMTPTIRTREQAQAWLKFKDYRPSTITLGPLTRLGGRMTSANIAFDDHPSEKRYSDRIETVTVDSVFSWLKRSELGATPVVLSM
ncbi:DUF2145 domain-containing protein [soil metagenome]